jgi:hypothetical protein
MAAQNITNTTDTLPRSQTLTGTITAGAGSKELVGTSTLFTSELRRGDWIFDTANTAIRQVERIDSDTVLWLKEGFADAQSGDTMKRVVTNARQISGAADGGDVTITFSSDDTLTVRDGNSFTPQAQENGLVQPFIVTSGSGVNFDYDIVN